MGSGRLDFLGLKEELLKNVRICLAAWLPGGKIVGSEYVCGSLQGEPGRSLSVNLRTGVWKDFATDEKGGDLIDLYAAINNLSVGDAAKDLSDQLGYSLGVKPSTPSVRIKPKLLESPPTTIRKPPTHINPPDFTHKYYGLATDVYIYRDMDGDILFYVARYDAADGGKQFYPWVYDSATSTWETKGWPAPRPLFGLDRLAKSPDKIVLVVEGEKACLAAQEMVGENYVVVTWANGALAWDKADLTPLYGRHLRLWPDRDYKKATTKSMAERAGVNIGDELPYEFQPGTMAMQGIADILSVHAKSIKIIDVRDPGPFAMDGFDAADMRDAGFSYEAFYDWVKPRARTLSIMPPPPIVEDSNDSDDEASEDDAPVSQSLIQIYTELGISTDGKGKALLTVENILTAIESLQQNTPGQMEFFKNLIWFDEFHQRLLTTWNSNAPREWEDVDELRLLVAFQKHLGMKRLKVTEVSQAVKIFAHNNRRNEPREWLESLIWDETPRIEMFLHDAMGVEDNEYTRAVSKNFFIAMAARIFSPGCKHDHMLILEGKQGVGKSTAVSILGGKYFGESGRNVETPDFFQSLHGNLIVEMGELSSFNNNEVEAIKKMLTCRVDRFRLPYDKYVKDLPRQSVFVGTTNQKHYLKDDTGARRFWPVVVTTVDLPYVTSMREQFFAEAVHLYKNGATWHEVPYELATIEQEKRRQVDLWEDPIAKYLQDKSSVTILSIVDAVLKDDIRNATPNTNTRIRKILHRLGWDSKSVREFGETVRRWVKVDE